MTDIRSVRPRPAISEVVEQLPLSRAHIFVLAATTLGFFFDSFDSGIMAVALPSITDAWKLSGFVGGLIGSASLWGMGLGTIILGIISDKFGRRVVMIVTVLGIALFTGLSALSFSATSLIVFRFVTGLFIGAMIPIDLAYVAEIAPKKYRGVCMAFLGLVWPLGSVASSVAGTLFLPTLGWRFLFVLAVLPAFVALWIRRQVPESPRWLAKQGRVEEAISAARRLGASIASADDVDTSRDLAPAGSSRVGQSFKKLFSRGYSPRTVGVSLAFFFTQFGAYGWQVWLPTILHLVLGINILSAVEVTILLYAGSVLGRLTLIATVNRIGRRTGLICMYIVIIACTLSVPLLLGTAVRHEVGVFIAIAFVYHVAADYSPLQLFAPELFPTEVRGLGTSIGQTVGRVGAGLGPIIFGIVVGSGQTNWVFYMIAICGISIILITLFVLRTETRGKSLADVGAK